MADNNNRSISLFELNNQAGNTFLLKDFSINNAIIFDNNFVILGDRFGGWLETMSTLAQRKAGYCYALLKHDNAQKNAN